MSCVTLLAARSPDWMPTKFAIPPLWWRRQLLAGNAEFYNLPRKFKVSLTGCRDWCSYPEINDVGLTAITRKVTAK